MIRVGPLKIKAQLFRGEEGAIGPGRADLLEAIDREGSISAAGRALGMSYRRTWLLVDSMNRCWEAALVETSAGGRAGSRLSALGREVLAGYRAMEGRIACAAQADDFAALVARLRPASPDPVGKPDA